MAVLLDMVRSLLVIIILAGFLELLLPEGSFRPWVRFAAGLFVLVAILSPLLNLLQGEHDFSLEAWDYRVEAAEQRQVMKQGAALNQQLADTGGQELEEKLNRQIEAVALLIPEVYAVQGEVKLNADGGIERLTLRLSTQPEGAVEPVTVTGRDAEQKALEEAICTRLYTVLESFYGLAPEQIEAVFE
ncbi:MAG: stage III sporulation protein AF [Syntrophomonadaceae bacterium]|nr:stage III sporulation protein AF [Syntrophomonadaceae bacterium]